MTIFPGAYYMSQDDFYHKRDSEHYEYIPEAESFNFDVITAIDMKKFHRKLEKIIKSGKYDLIFLDGILLFEDEKLNKMLDRKYFLDLDKEECYRRRQTRNYIIADTAKYFDRCVWNEFSKYKQKCQSTLKNVTYLNGSDTVDNIFNFVLSDIQKIYLPQIKI